MVPPPFYFRPPTHHHHKAATGSTRGLLLSPYLIYLTPKETLHSARTCNFIHRPFCQIDSTASLACLSHSLTPHPQSERKRDTRQLKPASSSLPPSLPPRHANGTARARHIFIPAQGISPHSPTLTLPPSLDTAPTKAPIPRPAHTLAAPLPCPPSLPPSSLSIIIDDEVFGL